VQGPKFKSQYHQKKERERNEMNQKEKLFPENLTHENQTFPHPPFVLFSSSLLISLPSPSKQLDLKSNLIPVEQGHLLLHMNVHIMDLV
jgi:hypothetical protein